MGSVFGKQTVAEPAYQVLYSTTQAAVPYEIRRYGQRFAVETRYTSSGQEENPFGLLAKYIGVFGTPQNEGSNAIDMTAPVVKQGEPVAIAMTAPVIKQGPTAIAMTAPVIKQEAKGDRMMQFILPDEYDRLDKIPKPTNPNVSIQSIPPAVGAVHRYSGSFADELADEKAKSLIEQLRKDGVQLDGTPSHQFWGFNPPFTLPFLRRNEVWIELKEEQVSHLVGDVNASRAN